MRFCKTLRIKKAKKAHPIFLELGLKDVFLLWENPWQKDLFFASDPYPPYLTPKNLQLEIPSLVQDLPED